MIFQEWRKAGLLNALVLCPSSGSIVVFHIYVSPELEAVTEPSQADLITIPSFL